MVALLYRLEKEQKSGKSNYGIVNVAGWLYRGAE